MRQVLERRLEFLKLEGLGLSLPEIVQELSQKYALTKRTIYYDSEHRASWQNMLTQVHDIERALLIYQNKLDSIYRRLSFIAVQGSEMAKVQALRVMLGVVSRQAELAGVQVNVPSKIEVSLNDKAGETALLLQKYNDVLDQAADLNLKAALAEKTHE